MGLFFALPFVAPLFLGIGLLLPSLIFLRLGLLLLPSLIFLRLGLLLRLGIIFLIVNPFVD